MTLQFWGGPLDGALMMNCETQPPRHRIRMQFVQTLKLLKELDECLEKIEGKIPSPPKR